MKLDKDEEWIEGYKKERSVDYFNNYKESELGELLSDEEIWMAVDAF